MEETVNVYFKVNKEVKEKAQKILNILGISMASALENYLSDVAMKGEIPFDEFSKKLKCFEDLTEEEIDQDIKEADEDYKNGKFISHEDLMKEFGFENI